MDLLSTKGTMNTLYEDLGLTHAINASGKMTALGGSRLDDRVIAAMGEAARGHVVMDDLLVAAGRELARATGTEDACPTTGAAAGIAIAVAALIAGTDPARTERLPDAGGAPNEVVLQKGHAVHFGASVCQMIAIGGGRPVEVGAVNKARPEHFTAAITDRTAALLYVQSHHAVQKGQVPLETVVAIGREHGIPVIVDAAAEEDLRRWPATGADLVVYSGGKAIGGPTSGLICGPADLIAACRAQYGGIGRPMKVGKESVLGLVQAVRDYGTAAGAVDPEQQHARMTRLAERVDGLPGLSARVVRDEAGRLIHRTELTVDPKEAGRNATELAAELAQGQPPVFLRDHHAATGRLAIDPRPLTLQEEEQIVARLTAILGGARATAGPRGHGERTEAARTPAPDRQDAQVTGRPAAGATPERAADADGTTTPVAPLERRLVVTEAAGLHARPAAAFAQAAGRSTAAVTVRRAGTEGSSEADTREVPARSVLSLMSLNIRSGEEIVLTAIGEGAAEALAELAAIAAPESA
ncbi:DgaE family pyridoxal phosphate-dependent ammonia lyase [Streptomyces sp. NPDC056696]|uniref:DgaE family pyridoxal phosphate-dependent ammonia lyase n=1 Tax=unclassified Streptomyces TaxID=2593676 RepID=UPI0036CEC4EF